MKAYFYCRVAHDDSFSLERQAEELRRYAEQAGYTIVGAAAEHGSGMTLDRPALQEVMEAVLAGKVDVVLISSLDRIGRDWGMTKQYIDLLTEHKVKLLCLLERVSSDSSGVSPFSMHRAVHYRMRCGTQNAFPEGNGQTDAPGQATLWRWCGGWYCD